MINRLAPEFHVAYVDATAKIKSALLEFENVTGCVVDNVSLERIDVTHLSSAGREIVQQVTIWFVERRLG